MFLPQSPLLRAFLLLFIVLIFGVLGFSTFEPSYTLFDAVYMTIITISTVGYSELGELSKSGRVFAMVFIVIGFVVFAYSIRLIGEYMLNGWTSQIWKQKKNKRMINKLNEHTIICGFGRNGRQAVSRLKRHKEPYVVIENNELIIKEYEKEILFYTGDALTDEALHGAKISSAKNLICSLPNDADNLFVVLSARQLKPDITIVSRVSEEINQSKLALAGANHVIMPDKIGGDYMAALLAVPDLIYFLGTLDWWEDDTAPNVEEVSLSRLLSGYKSKTLAEIQLREKTGCNVIGYRDGDGNQIINPAANLPLSTNGKLIILGDGVSLKKLNAMFDKE